jgi:hypothetical protein
MGLLSAGSHKRDKREEGKLCAHLMLAYITYYHHQMHDIFCRHPSLTEIPFTSDPPRSFCINQSRIRLHAISQGDKTNFFIFNVSISSLHTPYIEVSFSISITPIIHSASSAVRSSSNTSFSTDPF